MPTKEIRSLCDVHLPNFPADVWRQIKVSAVLKDVSVVEEMAEAARFYVEALSAKKK